MTANVVVCAPSWIERRALGDVPGLTVVRSGIGRRRSCATARSAELRRADAVAVVGVAGGLDPRLSTGDVVVADRVFLAADPDREIRLPAARMLAARLRQDGLRVWLGAVASASHVVAGAERGALRERGAIAVDMESAWLLPHQRPGAVVRVVADVRHEPVLRPATLQRLRSAARVLPALVPALRSWARAIDHRIVLLAEPRSFGAGVERAMEVVERALEQRGAPVYVRKQIGHNRHVVADLPRRGAVFVEELDEVPPGATVPQESLQAVATESDLVLVVGSKNSSNSLRLVETSRRLGPQAYLVDDADDVALDWLARATRVGLTAGALTPQALVDEVVDALSGLGPVDIRTRNVVTDDVRFTRPKEVRSA